LYFIFFSLVNQTFRIIQVKHFGINSIQSLIVMNRVVLLRVQPQFTSNCSIYLKINFISFSFRSLPFDTSTPRYVNLHGPLSCIVTTVHPQNPFNQIDNMSSTVNASLDSRSYFSLQDLPRRDYSK